MNTSDIESKPVDGFLKGKPFDDASKKDNNWGSSGDKSMSYEERIKSLNTFTWNGTQVWSLLSYDEYVAYKNYLDEFISNPPGYDDPEVWKQESADSCYKMADYELVETMDGYNFLGRAGGCTHINFRAKHKYNGDSSVYFAEFNFGQRKVTCFTKLHIDPSSGTGEYQRQCDQCHPVEEFAIAGYVYHPDNTTWIEGCLNTAGT